MEIVPTVLTAPLNVYGDIMCVLSDMGCVIVIVVIVVVVTVIIIFFCFNMRRVRFNINFMWGYRFKKELPSPQYDYLAIVDKRQ